MLKYEKSGGVLPKSYRHLGVTVASIAALAFATMAVGEELNVTAGGIGIGTSAPERSLHIDGSNAVFRMDRPTDTAAFLLARTDGSGGILKAYTVGVNAAGSNDGRFIISDLGTAVSGGGTIRMRINNDGTGVFEGDLHAKGSMYSTSFNQYSSIRYKENVQPLSDASRAIEQLQGVRFDWKENGEADIGFIAEEVASVFPEVIAYSEGGDVEGLNYAALVPVLVEGFKEQQQQLREMNAKQEELAATLKTQHELISEYNAIIATQQSALSEYRSLVDAQQERVSRLERLVAVPIIRQTSYSAAPENL